MKTQFTSKKFSVKARYTIRIFGAKIRVLATHAEMLALIGALRPGGSL